MFSPEKNQAKSFEKMSSPLSIVLAPSLTELRSPACVTPAGWDPLSMVSKSSNSCPPHIQLNGKFGMFR